MSKPILELATNLSSPRLGPGGMGACKPAAASCGWPARREPKNIIITCGDPLGGGFIIYSVVVYINTFVVRCCPSCIVRCCVCRRFCVGLGCMWCISVLCFFGPFRYNKKNLALRGPGAKAVFVRSSVRGATRVFALLRAELTAYSKKASAPTRQLRAPGWLFICWNCCLVPVQSSGCSFVKQHFLICLALFTSRRAGGGTGHRSGTALPCSCCKSRRFSRRASAPPRRRAGGGSCRRSGSGWRATKKSRHNNNTSAHRRTVIVGGLGVLCACIAA